MLSIAILDQPASDAADHAAINRFMFVKPEPCTEIRSFGQKEARQDRTFSVSVSGKTKEITFVPVILIGETRIPAGMAMHYAGYQLFFLAAPAQRYERFC